MQVGRSLASFGSLPPRVGARARRTGGVAVATATTHTTAVASTTAHAATVATSTARSAAEATTAAATPLGSSVCGTRTAAEATDIASSSSTTATTTASAAATAAAKASALTSDSLEESGNLLVGFLEKLEKVTNDTSIAAVEESSGDTSVSGTTSTTDTVDVVVNVGGKIVVDDVLDVGDIENRPYAWSRRRSR